MLPRTPRRAALAGLTLYEATTPRQRVASGTAGILLRCGLHRLLPENRRPEVPWEWWERWIAEVGEPLLGRIGHVAFRVPAAGRLCALLLDPDGRPVGFAKTLDSVLPTFSAAVRSRLVEDPAPTGFRVPRTIAEHEFAGVHFILFEPLPERGHRRPPADPSKVHAVIDEIRERLADMPRPDDVPSHHAVCHSGFTPRNVRVTRDGQWWVFDWDAVSWAPRLIYELRYWSAEFSYRLFPRQERDTDRVLGLLQQRGTDTDILEAVEWPHQSPTHRAIERDIHRGVADAIRRRS